MHAAHMVEACLLKLCVAGGPHAFAVTLLHAAEPLLAPGCLVIADNAGVFAQAAITTLCGAALDWQSEAWLPGADNSFNHGSVLVNLTSSLLAKEEPCTAALKPSEEMCARQ
eukprot:1161516-Pelagomonas_calceolata.AAC.6